jgi:hypothetical protein
MKNLFLATTIIATLVAYSPAHAESGEIKNIREEYRNEIQQDRQEASDHKSFVEERKADRTNFNGDKRKIHKGNIADRRAERKQKRESRRIDNSGQ